MKCVYFYAGPPLTSKKSSVVDYVPDSLNVDSHGLHLSAGMSLD